MLYSAHMRENGPSTRRTERMEILSELRGEVMVYQPMVLTELSRAGAQVETAFPLQIDSLHDFRFVLGDRSIVVKGRVVHEHVSHIEGQATTYQTGVEFVEPSERVVEAIGEFMDAVLAAKDQG
jgi:hypothetical protein